MLTSPPASAALAAMPDDRRRSGAPFPPGSALSRRSLAPADAGQLASARIAQTSLSTKQSHCSAFFRKSSADSVRFLQFIAKDVAQKVKNVEIPRARVEQIIREF